jgi:hypothetical protein
MTAVMAVGGEPRVAAVSLGHADLAALGHADLAAR